MTRPSGHERLAALWEPGRRLLGVDRAIMGGAMTWVSERNFVAAVAAAGGFGVIACGAMNPDQLDDEITGTRGLTDRPFGVNLIVMHPDLDRLIDVCIARAVTHIVLAGGLPQAATVRRIREAGLRVLAFAPALAIARRLVRGGIDGIVIEGMEAGGHIGPVSTSVLAQETLPHVDGVPVFVAGGIGRGEAIASYLRMGAAGVQLGTRFVCARESVAHDNFKKAFLRASARDAQPSRQLDSRFPVIPVRAIVNDGVKNFTEKQREVIARHDCGEIDHAAAQLEIEHFWAGALRRAVIEGDVKNGSLMAGQSVGMVTSEQSMADIMDELVEQAVRALSDQG